MVLSYALLVKNTNKGFGQNNGMGLKATIFFTLLLQYVF